MDRHVFKGKWITDAEFAALKPRNVFHKQLEPLDLPCGEHRNRHILFRRAFFLTKRPEKAALYISADDYYKLYINGKFVGQGPAPSYPQHMLYNVWKIAPFLQEGRNVIAVHTLYQGLINRVWVSGDMRHGLICDLEADGQIVLSSDGSFLTHPHTGFAEMGTTGYETQFLERQISSAPEFGFEQPDYDDSAWERASSREHVDYELFPQETKPLVFERIEPVETIVRPAEGGNSVYVDFGRTYVGYLEADARGKEGERIVVRCAQELEDERAKTLRYAMRCNCRYDEEWILSGGIDALEWFDYKSFRYAELIVPDGCEVENIRLNARHYPFALRAQLRAEYAQDEKLRAIWELCVHSLRCGVQETIQDCMDREKGFYVGDGCYTALAHMLLSGDDSMVRKLIDDAFRSVFITEGMVTCLDCSFMQEIAEYPLMLVELIWWHYRLTGDRGYLAQNYAGVCRLLDAYRRDYEKDGLLRDLDKWCVVEWPDNYRDGYDADLTQGQVCHEPHVSINAYYLEAIRCANAMAKALDYAPYRNRTPLVRAFIAAFYDPQRHLFTDSLHSDHISIVGNLFPFAFELLPDQECEEKVLGMIRERKIESVSFFCAFPMMQGLMRRREHELIRQMLLCEGAWLRMLREGATTTFEGWGRGTKWNTSLFHLTFSFAAIFLCMEDETFFDLPLEENE